MIFYIYMILNGLLYDIPTFCKKQWDWYRFWR